MKKPRRPLKRETEKEKKEKKRKKKERKEIKREGATLLSFIHTCAHV